MESRKHIKSTKFSLIVTPPSSSPRRGKADEREAQLDLFFAKGGKAQKHDRRRGLFARESIGLREIVVVKGGYVLTRAQRDQVGRVLGPSEIQITDDLFIGPTTRREREGGMIHLNPSCEPNLGLQGQVVYVALRDI